MKAECTVKLRCDLADFAGLDRDGENSDVWRASAEEQIGLTMEPDFEVVGITWDE